jgi:hypothetical protein
MLVNSQLALIIGQMKKYEIHQIKKLDYNIVASNESTTIYLHYRNKMPKKYKEN